MSKRRTLKDIQKSIDPKRCPECGKKMKPFQVEKVIYIDGMPHVLNKEYETVKVCKNPKCKKCHGLKGSSSIATMVKEEDEEE